MIGALQWFLPVYWPGKFWSLMKAGWKILPKPRSFVGKCVVYPLYAYVVIPGSLPYAIYVFAEWAGYGDEARQLVQICMEMFGTLGILCLDALGKVLMALLIFLFAVIS